MTKKKTHAMDALEKVLEKIGEETDKTLMNGVSQINSELSTVLKGDSDIGTNLKKLDNQLNELNETLRDFKGMFERDSSYATGVLLMISGAVLYMNSYDSVWKTAGIVLAVGGVSVVLK